MNLDRAFERTITLLGSTLVIVTFGVWMVVHTISTRSYLSFISEMAIFIGLLILRGQNIQSVRMERNIERTKEDTKKDLEKSDEIITMLQ